MGIKHQKTQVYRSFFFSLLFLLELVFLLSLAVLLCENYPFLSAFFYITSWCLVLFILNSNKEAGFKICWLLLLLPFPLVGCFLFIPLGGFGLSARNKKAWKQMEERRIAFNNSPPLPPQQHSTADPQLHYLQREIHCFAYQNTKTQYFTCGESAFPVMKQRLEEAKHYIFLEYFIIDHGVFWGDILAILKEKQQQGVEIRIIYDDVGCLFSLPEDFARQVKQYGIEARPFHPLQGIFTSKLNQRDHRKLLLVDGVYGFTGGINLSDQYINESSPYGYWKDSVLLLEGSGVWAMVQMFLAMWEYCDTQTKMFSKTQEDFFAYLPKESLFFQETSVVLPYNEVPLDCEPVAQRVFLNMITRAKQYIHMTTPYLILDSTTETILCNLAKTGIEVTIITPGIPDKKLVFQVTRSQYPRLLESGVKIYEYSPGFMHGKNVVVDGEFATVGSINLDYRSLFLHFEHGVWLWGCDCIAEMEQDFQNTLQESKEYFLGQEGSLWWRDLLRSILRVFSPFM